ncbi:phosphotransferase [Mycoplasmatota bacterium WC30]
MWNRVKAKTAVDRFQKENNLAFQSVELIRFGENAIYVIRDEELILRVYRPNKSDSVIENEIQLCEFLCQAKFPSVQPKYLSGKNLFTYDDIRISTWKYYEDNTDKKICYFELGKILKFFHRIVKKTKLKEYLKFSPILVITSRLEMIETTSNDLLDAKEFLLSKIYDIKETSVHLFENNIQIIHGDFHQGNILNTSEGLIVIDFENTSYGNYLFDLIPIAVGNERFSIDDCDYKMFCDGYGYDIKKHQDYRTLKSIREIYIIAWLSQFLNEDKKKNEFLKRVNTLKVGGNEHEKWSAK